MEIYVENSAVIASIKVGEPNPVAFDWALKDESGSQLTSGSGGSVDSMGYYIINIEPSFTLISPKKYSVHTIELSVTDASGVKNIYSHRYVVNARSEPEIPSKTFQSIPDAIILAMDIHGVDSFLEADERGQMTAMIEAARRISLLNFEVYFGDEQEYLYDSKEVSHATGIRGLTLDQFNNLPDELISAIKSAQVVEADEILGEYGEIAKRRAQGLMSESVGESSQMYQSGKPVDWPVSRRTMSFLAPFVRMTKKVGR